MKIYIRDLEVPALIGYYPEERKKPQSLTVCIEVEIPDTIAESDDIRLTVDYSAISRTALDAVAGVEILLVETVVQKIGRAVLRMHPMALTVDVEVYKHRIPDPVLNQARVSVRGSFVR